MPRLPHEEVTNSPETLIKKVHSVGSMWASTPTRIIETLVQIKYYVNHFEKRIFMDYTAAVITASDLGSQGKRIDTSGPAVCKMIEDAGFHVIHTAIIPDEQAEIQKMLIYCADELHANLILTTGGTGLSPRDVTPEATLAVLDREIRAIPVAMRVESLKVTPRAMLSRAVAGTRGKSLIINLPGSEKAAKENLSAIIGALEHAMHMISAEGH